MKGAVLVGIFGAMALTAVAYYGSDLLINQLKHHAKMNRRQRRKAKRAAGPPIEVIFPLLLAVGGLINALAAL